MNRRDFLRLLGIGTAAAPVVAAAASEALASAPQQSASPTHPIKNGRPWPGSEPPPMRYLRVPPMDPAKRAEALFSPNARWEPVLAPDGSGTVREWVAVREPIGWLDWRGPKPG